MKAKFYKLNQYSLTKNKVTNLSELWEKKKSQGFKGLEIQVKTVFTKAENEDNLFHATFSTDSEDRHGDVVVQNWVLKNFKANPVYLDSHNYGSIEHIIGKVKNLSTINGKLEGDIVFALSNPKGQMAMEMARDGFLNASSVGFIPLEFDNTFTKILKSELLEISAVSVPANQDATYDKKDAKSKRQITKDGSTEIIEPDDSEEERKEDKEEIVEPVIEEEIETVEPIIEEEPLKEKSTPLALITKVAQKEIDIKNHALSKILTAIKLVEQETKGRNSLKKDTAQTNQMINKAVRTLLKMKD